MTDAWTPLTVDVLERWRAAARAVGAPLAEELQPGISDAQIDALLKPLGLTAPPDLRTLWGWGTSRAVPINPWGWSMYPFMGYLRPERAVAQTVKERGLVDWGTEIPASWLVIWDDQERALCVDCAQPDRTPVYSLSAENTLWAESVAELVEHWTGLIADGFTEIRGDLWLETGDAPPDWIYGPTGDKQLRRRA
jgi:hypothetical protein